MFPTCYLFFPSTTDSKDKGSSVAHNQKAAGFTTIDLSVYSLKALKENK